MLSFERTFKLCSIQILLEKSSSEKLEVLKKAYGNGSSIRGFLPLSTVENETERASSVPFSEKGPLWASYANDSDEVIQKCDEVTG
ncbi:hypothetical protein TNCV_2695891 [Trichonephila clavipes]|nr:hypothetical protein TNCV_2695891 [Trichonephila clavipes]